MVSNNDAEQKMSCNFWKYLLDLLLAHICNMTVLNKDQSSGNATEVSGKYLLCSF